MTNKIKRLAVVVSAGFVFAGLIVVGLAHAQQMPSGGSPMGGMMGHGFPGVFGTVTGVSGTTIDVQSMMRNSSTTTTYSVDASDATVRKDNATSTVSAIAVGDMVMVRGTVSGDSVTATSIFDGKFMPGMGGMGRGGFGRPFNGSSTGHGPWNASGTRPFASSTMPMMPSISGTVQSVSGSTLTVLGSDGTTYTVDATNATLVKQGTPANSISAISVGDSVQVQGTINGTSVTANVILDNVPQNSTTSQGHGGFLGTLKSFFTNLFHFRF